MWIATTLAAPKARNDDSKTRPTPSLRVFCEAKDEAISIIGIVQRIERLLRCSLTLAPRNDGVGRIHKWIVTRASPLAMTMDERFYA